MIMMTKRRREAMHPSKLDKPLRSWWKGFFLTILLFSLLLQLVQSARIQAVITKRQSSHNDSQSRKPIKLTTRQLKFCLKETALVQTRGGDRRGSGSNGPMDPTQKDGSDVESNTIANSSEDGEVKVIDENEDENEDNDENAVPAGLTGNSIQADIVSSSDPDSDATESVSTMGSPEQHELIEEASQLRQQGKMSHDKGDFSEAASQFHEAASLLESCLSMNDRYMECEDTINFIDEWATCRLHETLCHLKAEDYDGCIAACSALLDSEDAAAMIRARAYHRRAKAKVALGDMDGALGDARSAAFLGDRKAVAFYGKLMRDSGSSTSGEISLPSSTSSSFGDSSSLLESLLNKSGPDSSQSTGDAFWPSSLLSSLGSQRLGPGAFGSKHGNGGLAKSVLSSLTKKLEDESTHDGICRYLQSTNPVQLQSMASMAGVDLSESQATRLVQIAHGITPKTIRKTVRTTKRAVWGFQLVRKTTKLISKYKNILFLLMLVQWTKSALSRPVPGLKVKAQGRNAKPATSAIPNK